jgi:hypothetical protein
MTGLDHLRQDRAGKVRLASAGSAEEQETSSARTHVLKAVGVSTAHVERLPLHCRNRRVVLEGPIQKPPRNSTAPHGALELRLRRSTPLGSEAGGLALADRGQLLSGGQRG